MRLWVETLDNPKVMRLPLEAIGLWYGLLLVAARHGDDGTLPPLADCAWMLHLEGMDAREFERVFDSLVDARLIDEHRGSYAIHDWYEWQPRERLPAHEWREVRRAVLERDRNICRYCGASEPTMHVDHVIPISRGGSNDEDNLVAACPACNLSKHAKSVEDWMR